jgi:hypothetical protein
MSGLPVERVVALDADFDSMAVEAGEYAVSLPGLTMCEKAFTWIASNVRNGHLRRRTARDRCAGESWSTHHVVSSLCQGIWLRRGSGFARCGLGGW